MDTVEFSRSIPPEMMATIFKNYFEQHMAAYYMCRGLNFVTINVSDVDKASIMYSVKLMDQDQKDHIVNSLRHSSANLRVYNAIIKPDIFINGDLLCITLHKEEN